MRHRGQPHCAPEGTWDFTRVFLGFHMGFFSELEKKQVGNWVFFEQFLMAFAKPIEISWIYIIIEIGIWATKLGNLTVKRFTLQLFYLTPLWKPWTIEIIDRSPTKNGNQQNCWCYLLNLGIDNENWGLKQQNDGQGWFKRKSTGFLNSRDRGLEPRFSLQPISRRIVWIL